MGVPFCIEIWKMSARIWDQIEYEEIIRRFYGNKCFRYGWNKLIDFGASLDFRPAFAVQSRGFHSMLLVWILLVLNLFSIGVKAVKPISSISWRSKDRVRHSLRWERFCRILVTKRRSESWARSRKEHRNLKSYFDFSPALPFFLFSKLNFCAWLSEHICYLKNS